MVKTISEPEDLFEDVAALIADFKDIPFDSINYESGLREHLGFDTLDEAFLANKAEKIFDIVFMDIMFDRYPKMTVRDVCSIIYKGMVNARKVQ
jgi:acyl carrier protein